MILNGFFYLLPIIFPIIAALCLSFNAFENIKLRRCFVFATVLINSIFIGVLLLFAPANEALAILSFTDKLSFALRVDGMSRIFGAIIAILWPITTIYAFDYMKHEEHKRKFFAFFLLSYAATAGVALAANLESMYLFFELLTLATIPLVMHKMDYEA
ncbi:MAG: proton-conducting membrane transporter, partial [Clostridia bacterium]|nr:proton-conducting membrane transporter [Clostridia bacterium]